MRQLQSLFLSMCAAAATLVPHSGCGLQHGLRYGSTWEEAEEAAVRLHNALVTRPEHSFGLCHASSQLYSPSRSLRLSDTPSLLEEVKQNVEGYGKLVLPSLVDMEDLAPDTGAICQKARFDRLAEVEESCGEVGSQVSRLVPWI